MDTCLLGGAVPSLPSVTQQPVRSRGAQLLQPLAGLHSSGSRYCSGCGGRACTAAAVGSVSGPTQHAWRAVNAQCTGRRRRGVVAAAAVATEQPPVAERLAGEDADQWAASLEEVKKAGFSDEDATALLERAFGWRTQTFWRGLKKEEVPVAESVAATLDFLRDLGMKDVDIQAALKKFPEGLASGVDERLKPNMQTLQKQYYIPEKNLLAAVKRQPKALGFSYDCEGSCEGECHRCWVRF